MADADHQNDLKDHTGCQECARRSDWDFLKTFYQREETAKQQIQSLNSHVVQLNAALHHAGQTSQKDRIGLNKSHEHMQEMQRGFSNSEAARAKLENELHEERQELMRTRENLEHERARHAETEKSMDRIWISHNRLGDIMSRVQCYHDDGVQDTSYLSYNITDLVFEITAKAQKVHDLEMDMARRDRLHHNDVAQLKEKLRIESAQHTEDYLTHAQRIDELENLLHRQTEEASSESKPSPKPTKRRRNFRGKGKASRGAPPDELGNGEGSDVVEQEEPQFENSLPVIKEEDV